MAVIKSQKNNKLKYKWILNNKKNILKNTKNIRINLNTYKSLKNKKNIRINLNTYFI